MTQRPSKKRLPCRHCRKRVAAKGRRGLCNLCFKDKALRERYPILPRPTNDTDAPSKPCVASIHRPGSKEDIAEKMRRLKLRQSLFSDGDSAHYNCNNLAAMTFATRIIFLRKRKAWTQDFLAAKAMLSQGAICHLEKSRRSPTLETLRKLAVALGEPLDLIATGVSARAGSEYAPKELRD
jgi:DNA-binding XRE family transcriptional regulator